MITNGQSTRQNCQRAFAIRHIHIRNLWSVAKITRVPLLFPNPPELKIRDGLSRLFVSLLQTRTERAVIVEFKSATGVTLEEVDLTAVPRAWRNRENYVSSPNDLACVAWYKR